MERRLFGLVTRVIDWVLLADMSDWVLLADMGDWVLLADMGERAMSPYESYISVSRAGFASIGFWSTSSGAQKEKEGFEYYIQIRRESARTRIIDGKSHGHVYRRLSLLPDRKGARGGKGRRAAGQSSIIGANAGLTTRRGWRGQWRRGRLWGFEPDAAAIGGASGAKQSRPLDRILVFCGNGKFHA